MCRISWEGGWERLLAEACGEGGWGGGGLCCVDCHARTREDRWLQYTTVLTPTKRTRQRLLIYCPTTSANPARASRIMLRMRQKGFFDRSTSSAEMPLLLDYSGIQLSGPISYEPSDEPASAQSRAAQAYWMPPRHRGTSPIRKHPPPRTPLGLRHRPTVGS